MLIGREGQRRVVTAADKIARAQGLRPGMAATQAQALVPGLRTEVADPEADEAALARLGLWALRRYSPMVAVDPPDGLMIDAGGVAHLHGGEEAMLADLVRRLHHAGIAARAAMAATHGAAHALARHAARPILAVGNQATSDALLGLPIAALRLPTDLVSAFRRLGFRRIGAIPGYPRGETRIFLVKRLRKG